MVFRCYEDLALTRQSDHRRAGPEDIHASCMAVTQWGVKTNISQLATADMLLLNTKHRKTFYKDFHFVVYSSISNARYIGKS